MKKETFFDFSQRVTGAIERTGNRIAFRKIRKIQQQGFEATQHISPQEVEQRAFKIKPINYDGRQVTFISIDTDERYRKNQDILPLNWLERVKEIINDPNLKFVFLEYAPFELANRAYASRLIGNAARSWGEQNIDPIYQPIVDLAAEEGKRVAVSDIATGMGYVLYAHNIFNYMAHVASGRGAKRIEETALEQFVPTALDARMVCSTEGLRKTLDGLPEGSSVTYVADPAHINRIEAKLTNPMIMDSVKRGFYAPTLIGLDTRTRIYSHTSQVGWTLESDMPYFEPVRQQFMPILLTAGVAASVAVARRARKHSRQK